MKYTYFLDFGSGQIEVFPSVDAVYKWEGDTRGFKRKVLSGDLSIIKDNNNSDVFNTLWEWYFTEARQYTDITIYIKKNNVTDYVGYFKVIDGSLDVNNGTYDIKPNTDDRYRDLMLNMENDVDIVYEAGINRYNATYNYTTVTQTETGTLPDQPPNIAPVGTWVQIGNPNDNIWARQQSQYLIDGWTKAETSNFWYKALEDPVTINFSFPNCYKLIDIIQLILDRILFGTDSYGMEFKSEFFTDSTNYLTGEVNQLMNTLIEQKSDAKDPTATNKATKGILTLQDLMQSLNAIFVVDWYVDDDGYFRIEHEKYFYKGLKKYGDKQTCVDLTNEAKYRDVGSDKMYIEDTLQYTTNTDETIKYEKLQFLEEGSSLFRRDLNYIEYTNINVDKPATAIKTTLQFTTDVTYIHNESDQIGDDGFVLFNCYAPDGNNDAEIITITDSSERKILNGGFSTYYLLKTYYTYGRPHKTATIITPNGDETLNVLSTQSIIMQKDISFLLSDNDNIDINKYISTFRTEYGGQVKVDGNIIEIEHDLSTDFVTVTLGYEL